MSALEQKIKEDLVNAMKAGRKEEVSTLRTVLAQTKNERISLRRELEDEDITKVLMNAVKKRKDSIEMFKQGNRQDLVDKEEKEVSYIERYLPEQISDEEIAKVVDKIIAETGALSMKEIGKVMGPIMAQLKGKADGKKVQSIVRDRLS
jgi:uncharacterized protein YqeY